ncbi:MAG TPA: ribulose-phosphate 3-epimerase [Candidatus Eubacterium faecipullorum]|uniref:Ribulose-phosphate 3-epimerase n=1 Tax=Candidatus Eubacterium faecipullorum TaxID=2838571 RepID=A0A9D1UFT0_9FIRM|nr:ribulose-phosphate 3-epimerase [Candidatus Eubacterium faecipullorum]
MEIKIAPSVLAADYANLETELKKCAAAQYIHLDVMDGHFVPNISIGAPVIKSLRNVTEIPFDVHLMISEPLRYVEDFADAGADIICFHIESESDTEKTVNKILECGCRAAIAIKPGTPASAVLPYLSRLAMVLVMTVEPGFGGQSFMEDMMPKIKEIRAAAPDIDIEVDGGVNPETIKTAASAGANVFVAGSAVFKSEDPAKTIEMLKDNAKSVTV